MGQANKRGTREERIQQALLKKKFIPEIVKKPDDFYVYPQAYSVREFTCAKCGAEEWIWNSVNKPCPEAVRCLFCDPKDSVMNHTNKHLDRRDPSYKLKNGDRYFARYSFEEAHEAVATQLLSFQQFSIKSNTPVVETGSAEYNKMKGNLLAQYLDNLLILKTFTGE